MIVLNLFTNEFFRNEELEIKRLGSLYGGWYVCCSALNQNTRIISMGAGEDVSFDVEIANNYGCLVDIFDPTPRAIQHFKSLKKQYGRGSSEGYDKSGAQNICSYNLQNVSKDQISYIPKAVWIKDGSVKFFVPLNKNSVSHTITGYNSNANEARKSIQVDCVDILKIKIEKDDVLKLDIEGAELPVLKRLIRNSIPEKLPRQILVEFDELQVPKILNFQKVYLFHRELKKFGYNLIKKDKINFTYFRNKI